MKAVLELGICGLLMYFLQINWYLQHNSKRSESDAIHVFCRFFSVILLASDSVSAISC